MNRSVYIPKGIVDDALASAPLQGKHHLARFTEFAEAAELPVGAMRILEDHYMVNDAEVHRHEADLWECLEGVVTFTVGGELVEPWPKKNEDGTADDREWKAKQIRGGETIVMRPGDRLFIPAGVPHKHDCPEGTARLVIVKIPVAAQ